MLTDDPSSQRPPVISATTDGLACDDTALYRLARLGVDAVVTTRNGGCSEGPFHSLNLALHVGDDPERVRENRRRALGFLGSGLGDLILGEQVHGSAVAHVTDADRGRGSFMLDEAISGADALITTDYGVVLGVLVADCVPLLLYHQGAAVLACAHAGWRGTAARIGEQTLAAMQKLGAEPSECHAYLGPAIGGSDYQIDRSVALSIARCFDAALEPAGELGTLGKVLEPDGPDHWRLDLVAANHRILVESGMPAERIYHSPCTTADPRLFSYRRSRKSCGRFALLARLRP